MAQRYEVTDCVGTEYSVDENNLYTGEVKKMWDAESKQKALARFVDLYDIDLAKSYAYGDTNGDVSMFEKVGHPVAINPTRELLSHLRCDEKLSKIVDIVVERKDVIYKLDTSVYFNSPQFCE